MQSKSSANCTPTLIIQANTSFFPCLFLKSVILHALKYSSLDEREKNATRGQADTGMFCRFSFKIFYEIG